MASISEQLSTYRHNLQQNLGQSLDRLALKDYIRLTAIVGAYCLLRPYLLKLGARFQAKDHERDVDPDELSSAAAMSPNTLRGQVTVPEDSESEEDMAVGTGANWGKKARRRQRQMVRKIVEAEEKLRAEEAQEDSDKDIEEFLEK
ncbi:hypothetical protein MMC20_006893 [Loxospora ochrophaea]|nr:hypothetical protein [Loxospora ochrophaea]